MNSKKFLSAVALAGLSLATLANAESYDGVLITRPDRLRTDLALEAREAALKPVAGEASWADNFRVPVGQLARADVRRDAESAARAGNLHGDYAGAGVLSTRGSASAHHAEHNSVRSQAREIPRTSGRQATGG
jgi:hypothetical protein